MNLQNQEEKKVQFDFHAFRLEKALTQKELSDLLGISEANLSIIESSKDPVSDTYIDIIKKKYGDYSVVRFFQSHAKKKTQRQKMIQEMEDDVYINLSPKVSQSVTEMQECYELTDFEAISLCLKMEQNELLRKYILLTVKNSEEQT